MLKVRKCKKSGFLLGVAGLLSFVSFFSPFCSWAQSGGYGVVGVPRFVFNDGTTLVVGKVFVVAWSGARTFAVTVLHLLGPEGGYTHYVPAAEVGHQVNSVEILDLQGGSVMATARKAVLRSGVPVELNGGDPGDDLVAFECTNAGRMAKLTLSRQACPVGARVWLYTKADMSGSQACDRYMGVVQNSDAETITIKLQRPLDATSSSGSPVLNDKNELVGMMVGRQDDTRTTFVCIQGSSIYQKIAKDAGQ